MSKTKSPAKPGEQMITDPLVLTLHLDEASFAYYNHLRKTHFPAGRNLVPAHISLFHQLPGRELEAVQDDLSAAAKQPVFDLLPNGLMFMGGGVAYRFSSDDAVRLHGRLADKWQEQLIPQDRKPLAMHITVQNKVSVQEARKLYKQLEKEGHTKTVRATGIDLWHYRNGPWEFVRHFAFG